MVSLRPSPDEQDAPIIRPDSAKSENTTATSGSDNNLKLYSSLKSWDPVKLKRWNPLIWIAFTASDIYLFSAHWWGALTCLLGASAGYYATVSRAKAAHAGHDLFISSLNKDEYLLEEHLLGDIKGDGKALFRMTTRKLILGDDASARVLNMVDVKAVELKSDKIIVNPTRWDLLGKKELILEFGINETFGARLAERIREFANLPRLPSEKSTV